MALYDDVVKFVWPNALVVLGVAVTGAGALAGGRLCVAASVQRRGQGRPHRQGHGGWVSWRKPGSR